jgi:nicotinamidase-related amidase
MKVTKDNSAIILIGYQNDYFHKDGAVYDVIESSSKEVLKNTLKILDRVNDIAIFSAPIIFTQNYQEISDPVGILQTIKESGAFQKGSEGARVITELDIYKDKMIEVPGKIGFNSFYNTNLDNILSLKKIENIFIVGALCAICVDSTARAAHDNGYNVSVVWDAISGRTDFEVSFYREKIFPLYSNLLTSDEIINQLGSA